MYKLIWKQEIIDEVDNKEEANILMQEYNLAYKGGVTHCIRCVLMHKT